MPPDPTTPIVTNSINWKKIIATVVVVLVVVGVIAGGIYWYVQNQTSDNGSNVTVNTNQTATSSAKKDETADCKTYENKKDGYSIKYPDSYSFVSAKLLPANAIEIRSQNYQEQITDGTRYMKKGSSLSIELAFPRYGFVGDISAYKSSSAWFKTENQKNLRVTKVAGYDANRFDYEPKTDLKYEIVTLETGGKLYEFWFQAADSDRVAGTKIFDLVLSTFKFL